MNLSDLGACAIERNVRCDYCGNTEHLQIVKKNVNGTGHNLVLCHCGLMFFDPRVAFHRILHELAFREIGRAAAERACHKGTSMLHADDEGFDIEKQKKFNREYYKRHYDKLKSLIHNDAPRVLDVGCGVGWGLRTYLNEGADPTSIGIDLNTTSVKLARSEFSLNVRHHPFLWTPPNVGPFDVVMCNDYLEHTYTPFQDLKLMRKLTVHGGVMFLKTFDEDLDQEQEGWMTRPPWHAHHFRDGVLKAMLHRAGWKVLEDWVTWDTLINYYCLAA